MPLKPEVLKGWPPHGWQFFQPETNWEAPNPLQYNFQQQVRNIIHMRKANPRFKLATNPDQVALELEAYTGKRLAYDAKFWAGDEAEKKKPQTSSSLLRQGVEKGAAVVDIDADALAEWLGDGGKPVDSALAERRASVCVTCSENSSSDSCEMGRRSSWKDWITSPVASLLRQYLGFKHALKLETSKDAKLGKCLACRCELPLKVWTPLPHIVGNMEKEVAQKLPAHCWVLTEQQ